MNPLEKLDENTKREMVNLKFTTELMRIHKEFTAKVDELQSKLDKIKQGPPGPMGLPGPKGEKGDPGKDGKDGATPIKGLHYSDGKPGRHGRDGKSIEVDTLIQTLDKLPVGKKLNVKHIDGLEQTIQAINSQIGQRGYVHGGGDTVQAGTGISIVANSDGTKTITSIGGFTTLAATETPDGVITVFTFAAATAKPSFIIVDNVMQRATTKKGTVNWTWNSVSKQATLTVPPQDDILGIV